MTAPGHETELTVASLKRDLAELRQHGLHRALEKEKAPLLVWLARQKAADHDSVGFRRLTTGTADDRRQAAAEHIKVLIEPAVVDLPEKGSEGVAKLFALDAPSLDKSPESPARYEEAADAAGHTPSYVRRWLAAGWVDHIATRMYRLYIEYATTDDHLSGNRGTPADNEPTGQGDQQTDQTVAPKLDTAPAPAAARSTRGRPGAWMTVAAISSLLGAGVLIAAIVTRSGGGTIVGGCGATTAQLFDPVSSTETPSDIYMYAPHQEGGQHGWADYFLDYPQPQTHHEAFHVGEVRLIALSYRNTSPNAEKNIVARAAPPKGATLVPDSTCLYRDSNYSSGTRYSGTPLLAPTGLKIGRLATNAGVYVTFQMRLQTTPNALVDIYGGIGSEDLIGGPEWTQYVSYIRLP